MNEKKKLLLKQKPRRSISDVFKVLSSGNEKLSISNVQVFLKEGDDLIKSGEFDRAKESYDKARNLAKQLAGFYGGFKRFV